MYPIGVKFIIYNMCIYICNVYSHTHIYTYKRVYICVCVRARVRENAWHGRVCDFEIIRSIEFWVLRLETENRPNYYSLFDFTYSVRFLSFISVLTELCSSLVFILIISFLFKLFIYLILFIFIF